MARTQPSPSTARGARSAVLALGAFSLLAGCTSSERTYTIERRRIEVDRGDSFAIELADDSTDDFAWEVSIDPFRLSALERWAGDQPHVRDVAAGPTGRHGAELEVFLDLERPDGDTQLEADLRADPSVRKVVFIDQAEQFELFREFYSDEPEFLESFRVEDMPASYRVYLHEPAVRVGPERNRDGTYRIAFEATRRDELVVSFSYRSRAGREREVKRFTVVVS
jgi:hypothetical protein